jgi:tetratricopeptide (TPR) repeat protein
MGPTPTVLGSVDSTVEPTRSRSEPTSQPTNTPTPTLTPTPTPTYLTRASLPPITHTYQTWNNCGPATLSMALIYFDQAKTQADTAAFLIAAGLPVIVETWFIPEPGDQMGHYRLLTGYDDEVRQLTAQDAYNGPNVGLDYDAFDELWRVFNRVYLVVYDPAQADQLAAILGEDVDDRTMYTRALETAQTEAANPSAACLAYEDCADGTAFAWFNVGSSLTALGRHQEAAAAYDQARLLGLPWRMLWYQFGPYESYYAVQRYDDVVTLATVTLNVVGNLEESYYWRGMAYLAQEKAGQARDDFKAAVKYNPNFAPAVEALGALE